MLGVCRGGHGLIERFLGSLEVGLDGCQLTPVLGERFSRLVDAGRQGIKLLVELAALCRGDFLVFVDAVMLVRRAGPQQDSAESLEAVLADDILVVDLLAELEEYRAASLRLHRLREVVVDQEHFHLLDGRPRGLLDGLLVGLFLLLDTVDVPVGDMAGELA